MEHRQFAELRGLIAAKFDTHAAFAREMQMSRTTLSAKLNGKVDWQGHEIARACGLLGVPLARAYEYKFF